MSGDRGLEWSAVAAVFEAEIEKWPENIKKKAKVTRIIHSAPTTPLQTVPVLVSAPF